MKRHIFIRILVGEKFLKSYYDDTINDEIEIKLENKELIEKIIGSITVKNLILDKLEK
jgi:hypothetical protein